MSNISEFETNTDISRILQFLQTLHQKFRKNREIINSINSQKHFVCVKRSLQVCIRTFKKNSHKDINLSSFRLEKAKLYRK